MDNCRRLGKLENGEFDPLSGETRYTGAKKGVAIGGVIGYSCEIIHIMGRERYENMSILNIERIS